MRVVAIDGGNTHLNWGLFQGSTLVETGRLANDETWSLPLESWSDIAVIAVACVQNDSEARLRRKLESTASCRVLYFGGVGIAVPVRADVPDPHRVGVDRLLNSLAWHARSSRPGVVIDFGTAITFDLVAASGTYRGGLILPGPELIARSLEQGTSLLPRVDIHPTPERFGRDTESCVRRGVFGLVCGGVDFHVRELAAVLSKETCFIATGGGAAAYAPYFKRIDAVLPWLTLDGIRLAVEGLGLQDDGLAH